MNSTPHESVAGPAITVAGRIPTDCEFKKTRTESRIPELDGVRGTAILLVISFHFFGISAENHSWLATIGRAVLSLTWSGVDLFFVLSGFLIGGILMDNRDSENYFSTFYLRRASRILPLYFVWLSVFFIFQFLFSTSSHGYLAVLSQAIPHVPKWGYICFLQNFYIAKTGFGSEWLDATWSLSVEEQFYLILPLAIAIASPRKQIAVFVAIIVFAPLLRIFLFLFYPSIFAYVLLPCRADPLLLGVLCAYLIRHPRYYSWLTRNQRILNAAFFILMAGMIYLVILGSKKLSLGLINSFDLASFGFSCMALFYACLILIVTTNKGGLTSAMMRTPLLRHFGIIAYGMYLSHVAINAFIRGVLLGKDSVGTSALLQMLVTFLAFLATWAFAALSWRFFERPIVRWGHSFSYAPRKNR